MHVYRFRGMTLREERAKHYLETGVWSHDTFIDVMEHNVRRHGPLVHRDDTSTLTYEALWAQSEAVAAYLYSLGIRKHDKVAIQLPTSLDFLVALFGITRLGAIAVILQADLGRQNILDSLQQCGASIVIATETYQGHPVAETLYSLADDVPGLETVMLAGSGGATAPTATATSRLRTVSFDTVKTSGSTLDAQAAADNRPDALDPFVMVFTAGTTGRPRGIVHLHANTLWAARTYARLYDMPDASGTLCLAPVYHLTGFLVGVTLPVVTGSRMLLQSRFAVRRVLRVIANEQPQYIVGAPPHLIHIANEPTLKNLDVSSVRMFFYAGAPVPSDILRQLQADTGWTVGGMFGWSEGFLASATRPDDPVEAINQTVGQAIPGTEVRLVDDDGRDIEPGLIGEVWCRGPNFGAGYYNQPEAAAEKWDDEGWFHSGDLLRQDADGRYAYKGRADNIINRGGTKIDPREVEAVMAKHPSVRFAALIAVPDDTLGHKTHAAIVVSESGSPFAMDELRTFLTQHGLAKYQFPDTLQFYEVPADADDSFGVAELKQLAQRRNSL